MARVLVAPLYQKPLSTEQAPGLRGELQRACQIAIAYAIVGVEGLLVALEIEEFIGPPGLTAHPPGSEGLRPASAPLTLFYCYARKDQALRDEIDVYLAALHRGKLVTSWHDAMIVPGTDWEREIDTHLEAASVILLLVSPDFIHSDYCYGREMQRAIERHLNSEAHVIPILLRPVDWEDTPFSTLHMLPTDAKPVTQWSDRDAAFADIARGIRRVITTLIEQRRRDKASSMTDLRITNNSIALSHPEIVQLINQYIGVSDGYLGDFSYRTHVEFYLDYCNLNINPNEYQGTTRERFITILSSLTPRDQAAVVRGVLNRFPVEAGPATRTAEMRDKFLQIIQRLESGTPYF